MKRKAPSAWCSKAEGAHGGIQRSCIPAFADIEVIVRTLEFTNDSAVATVTKTLVQHVVDVLANKAS